jgi:hypothetical protein
MAGCRARLGEIPGARCRALASVRVCTLVD